MSERVTAEELPLGAIENGREHLRRLVEHYDFECEGGPLRNCVDFTEAAACFEHLVDWSRRAADTIAALEREAKPVKFRWVEVSTTMLFYELRVGSVCFGRVKERHTNTIFLPGFTIENHITGSSSLFEGTLEEAQARLVAEVLKQLRGGE